MYAIPLIKPYVTDKLRQRVLDVLDSGYLTEGSVTQEFETAIRDFIGCRHALAVTSCTAGLEVGLRCLGIGPGDEVIVPDYTYPATACVVNIVGATAVVVDVDPRTMLIDCDALERAVTPRTRAVIPVSLFGSPLDYGRLDALKAKHGFFILEDAACSLGASQGGAMVGTHADISVFSFHPRKFVTTGEGGVITTDNAEWADWMLSYKHFGMGVSESRLATSFDRIGANYKLSNVLAAIGLAQMEDVDELLAERRVLAARYKDLLAARPGIDLPEAVAGGEHSWQTFCVFVKNRDAVMAAMREKGIEAQIGTYSLHMHKAFNDNPLVRFGGDMANSAFAFRHALALPMFHGMTEEEHIQVVDALAAAVG
ncbi:DegT/DnrJ/EryC1/StrS aminotransferase [Alkalidesulfovibrio alkalitolerans DSM 16529]|uniref:DegT/DnrJ/EryC1/StrS aminotransferase n=1 Tax=Alkalidesulfovibrio alkalitolerans DSM 16529 TaxID=1121439 RepID=S7UQ80_9BACT|nr:DegT/DnrJ/EryC1/StrS family aminotransferase [Alkalidesulfovibrio alkalitolerans]EPR36204.1 DegT/DnrJ/EryC1/StrS aminotransferase [Alkalidesulfovibrio alkalitolerans DSM 16529]